MRKGFDGNNSLMINLDADLEINNTSEVKQDEEKDVEPEKNEIKIEQQQFKRLLVSLGELVCNLKGLDEQCTNKLLPEADADNIEQSVSSIENILSQEKTEVNDLADKIRIIAGFIENINVVNEKGGAVKEDVEKFGTIKSVLGRIEDGCRDIIRGKNIENESSDMKKITESARILFTIAQAKKLHIKKIMNIFEEDDQDFETFTEAEDFLKKQEEILIKGGKIPEDAVAKLEKYICVANGHGNQTTESSLIDIFTERVSKFKKELILAETDSILRKTEKLIGDVSFDVYLRHLEKIIDFAHNHDVDLSKISNFENRVKELQKKGFLGLAKEFNNLKKEEEFTSSLKKLQG
jgi:CRISPR/Cas system CMR-associated protein Cmr5 small subunit